mmetsp:Transcript_1611/g.3680  ORF Transcript_1611/g.3680 Transcript_1611/m.3680 type:complete len:217 (+) Transcript_1611:300-950(+)
MDRLPSRTGPPTDRQGRFHDTSTKRPRLRQRAEGLAQANGSAGSSMASACSDPTTAPRCLNGCEGHCEGHSEHTRFGERVALPSTRRANRRGRLPSCRRPRLVHTLRRSAPLRSDSSTASPSARLDRATVSSRSAGFVKRRRGGLLVDRQQGDAPVAPASRKQRRASAARGARHRLQECKLAEGRAGRVALHLAHVPQLQHGGPARHQRARRREKV